MDDTPTGSGETILLVEDNADVREVNTAVLEALGYRVLSAATAPDALALWDANRDAVDLVLSDLLLPGQGGAEMCRALRARGMIVPVIMLSGHREALGREAEGLDGIAAWLQKPVEIEELARVVHGALAARRRAG